MEAFERAVGHQYVMCGVRRPEESLEVHEQYVMYVMKKQR
jgi:hypothetical protein